MEISVVTLHFMKRLLVFNLFLPFFSRSTVNLSVTGQLSAWFIKKKLNWVELNFRLLWIHFCFDQSMDATNLQSTGDWTNFVTPMKNCGDLSTMTETIRQLWPFCTFRLLRGISMKLSIVLLLQIVTRIENSFVSCHTHALDREIYTNTARKGIYATYYFPKVINKLYCFCYVKLKSKLC